MTPSALAANAGGLAKVAHAIKAPSLFLTVPRNGKPGELLPELQPYATAENTIYRENADPFRVKQIVDAIKNPENTPLSFRAIRQRLPSCSPRWARWITDIGF